MTILATPESGHDRIMDVAAAQFLANGYDATSLRNIADEVGMKAGSLYYHFASKDDLLTAILSRGIDVMQAAFDTADTATSHAQPIERIETHVRAHLSALFENGPYTAAHVMTFRTSPSAVRQQIVPLRDAYEARWTELLQQLQIDDAMAPATDLNFARLILFGAMNSSVEWFDTSRGSLDAFASAITTQFWNGVAA